jgi:hypothetical protein
MAQDVEVKVKIDTSDANSSINDLNKSVGTLGKTTQTTQEKTKDYAKEIIGNSKLTGALSKATGGLSDAFINAARGANLTTFSLKGLKAAIISTGVGLLVIALTEMVNIMVDMFDKTKESEAALKDFNDETERAIELQDEHMGILEKRAKLDRGYAEANGKNAKQLFEMDKKSLNDRNDANEEFLSKQLVMHDKIRENDKLTEEDKKKAYETTNAAIAKSLAKRISLNDENNNLELSYYKQTKDAQRKLDEKSEQDAEKNAAERKQRLAALAALEKKYQQDIENIQDKTGQQRLDREKQRALEELKAIKLSEEQKAKARALIIKDFALKQEVFDKEQADKAKLITEQFEKEKQDILAKSDQEKLNLQKDRDSQKLEEELKTLEVSETRKNELRLLLKQKYDLLQTELTKKTNETDAAESQKVLEDIQNANDTTLEQKQSALAEETAMVQAQFDAKTITEEQYNEKVKFLAEQRKKIGDLEVAWKQKQVGNMGNAFAQLASLAGESTAAGKAFAVAATTISTYQAAQSAYQSAFMPVPTAASPVLGGIYAAVAVASGLANIQKILSVQTPNGKGGSSGGVSAPAPAPQFNVVGASGVNQLSESLNIQNKDADKPIKAFVVSGEVTSGQSLDRNIIRNATLGG